MKKLLLFLCFFFVAIKANAQQTKTLGYKNFGLSWFPIPFYTIDSKIVVDKSARELLKTNPSAHRSYKQGVKNTENSWYLLGGSCLFGILADRQKPDSPRAWTFLSLGIGSLVGTLILDQKSMRQHRKAVDIYNEKIIGSLEKRGNTKIHVGILPSGNVGFLLTR